jgi:hypothetical protein
MDTESNASLAIKDRMLRIDTKREEEDQAFALDYEEIELLSADMEERQASEEKPSSLIHSPKNYHLGRGSRVSDMSVLSSVNNHFDFSRTPLNDLMGIDVTVTSIYSTPRELTESLSSTLSPNLIEGRANSQADVLGMTPRLHV